MNRQFFVLLMIFGLATLCDLVGLGALDEQADPGYSLIEQTRVGLLAQNDTSFGVEVAVEEIEDAAGDSESAGDAEEVEEEVATDESDAGEDEEEIEESSADETPSAELKQTPKQLVESSVPKNSWFSHLLTLMRFRA